MVTYLIFNVVECIRGSFYKGFLGKLETLYQSKSLVNKLFLGKKFYNLRMDLVTEDINSFNTLVS